MSTRAAPIRDANMKVQALNTITVNLDVSRHGGCAFN